MSVQYFNKKIIAEQMLNKTSRSCDVKKIEISKNFNYESYVCNKINLNKHLLLIKTMSQLKQK